MVEVEDSSQLSSVIPYQLNKKESTSNTVKEQSETSPSNINPPEKGENGDNIINASGKIISGLSPEEPPPFFKTKNMGENEGISTITPPPPPPPPQAVIAEVDNIDGSTPNATITTPSLLVDVPNPLPPVGSREITNKKMTTTTTTKTATDSPKSKANTTGIPKASSLKKTNAKNNSNNNNGGKRTFTATVTDYDPQICDGFLIEAAVACFVLKGEDRYTFVTNSSEPMLDKVQSMTFSSQPSPPTPSSGSKSPRSRNKQKSTTTSTNTQQQQQQAGGGGGVGGYTIGGNDIDAKLVAFAGVFDGHDGEKASQYCSRGMLHHILAETNRVSQKVQKEQQSNKSSGSSSRSFFGGTTSNSGGESPPPSSCANSSSSSPATSTSFKNKSRTTFFGPKSNTSSSDNNQSTSTNVISKNSNNKDINIQVLKQGHVNGYTWAQSRFGSGCHPPTWDELLDDNTNIQQIRTGIKSNAGSFLHRLIFGSTSIRTIRGGTTATTIALYSKSDDSTSIPTVPETIDEEETKVVHDDTTTATTSRSRGRRRRRPVLCALVACAGDSRCITDDGGTKNAYGPNLTEYRAVTKDHRPNEPEESRRIQKLVRRGVCLLQKDDNVYGTLRLYPGGLAVSRTVGDVQLTEAAIPTPEVFTVPLNFDTKNETKEQVTYRFVIASDGLWDVYDTDEVGRIVSQDIIDNDDKKTNIDNNNNNNKEEAANDGGGITKNDHDDKGNNSTNNNTVHDNLKSNVSEKKRRRTPKQAAKELLDSCIKQGGYEDDVTILVLDISLAPSSCCTSSTDED